MAKLLDFRFWHGHFSSGFLYFGQRFSQIRIGIQIDFGSSFAGFMYFALYQGSVCFAASAFPGEKAIFIPIMSISVILMPNIARWYYN